MATLVSFWSFFWDRMANLGLIEFKLGLYIKVNVNARQNEFEVHISKTWPKLPSIGTKQARCHFGARASHGHNLAIFHPILTKEYTKNDYRVETDRMDSKAKLYLLAVEFGFWGHFCSKASHGQCCTYGLKTTLKLLVHVLAIMANSYLKIVFSQKSGLNPPPPPPPPPLTKIILQSR